MKRFFFLLSTACLLYSCKSTSTNEEAMFVNGKWVDLTYSYSDKTVYWPTVTTGFQLDTIAYGETPGGFFYSAYNYSAPEHGGTHLDAPVHFAEGKWSADEIPVTSLTGAAVVIDVSKNAKGEKDYLISIADVEEWEKENGDIPNGAIVLFKTGYGQYYPDAVRYLGTAQKGAEGIANLHFPGIDPALAEWLVKNRQVKAVGLDTASVDYGQSKDFQTHRILYAANIPGFENVANLDELPAKGAYVVALPMKIKGGSGAPLRMIAWVKN